MLYSFTIASMGDLFLGFTGIFSMTFGFGLNVLFMLYAIVNYLTPTIAQDILLG